MDTRAKGKGFGKALLIDLFIRVLAAARSIGCAGILVHAKDEEALSFYKKYGFRDLDPEAPFPRSMLIALETVRAAS